MGKPKKQDPDKILLRIWMQNGGTETVKKFLIDRKAMTVDIDLWVSTEMKTSVEAQCNYPAAPVEE